MDSPDKISQDLPGRTASDTIDFSKLLAIFRNNWPWILLVFIVVNSLAYLVIRYTRNLYQSSSEIKLDIKSEATGFGIKNIVEDQYLNLMSGEIEIIKSRLFLTRVVEKSDFEVSFISVGRFLSDELFRYAPAVVKVNNKNHHYYNTPIHFSELSTTEYSLSIGEQGKEITGQYGKELKIDDLSVTLERNADFRKGDEVSYYFVINSKEALLNYLVSNLTAEPLNYNANTLGISFKDHNPLKAQTILNKIDTVYIQYSNEQKNLATKQKIDWVVNELGQIEKKMEDYENYFKQFMLENKTNNLDEDVQQTIAAIKQVDSLRFDFARKVNEIDRLKDRFGSPDFQIPVYLRTSMPASLSQNLDDLQKLILEQQKLKLSYNEITFAYRSREMQIEALKTKAAGQLIELKSEWLRKLQELNQRKVVLDQAFRAYPDKNTEFTKNQRFYNLYEEFYLTLMQSKSEFEIAQAGTTADFRILSPATFPASPISPNRPMITGVGFVASMVINFFFIGILYLINNKITSISELEKVKSSPVLGSVPVSRYSNGTGLHILDHPKSMVSEAIRTLRTNLDFFNPGSKQKIVAISSTVSGEGKSFIAMNLGAVMALSKKKVILIDLDMRKAKTNQPVASIDTTKGVSTILIRKHTWTDCIVKTSLDNFDFIPAGPHPPNPSELLLNEEFSELIANLKQNYDFIILDTPPVGLVTDGIMAMRRADVSIYIFRANYSKKDFLTNLQRIITINKFSNITTILNAVPASGKTYGYGYYEESKRQGKLRSLLQV
jgi:tyrosine-protein kinase Etk/Wzc